MLASLRADRSGTCAQELRATASRAGIYLRGRSRHVQSPSKATLFGFWGLVHESFKRLGGKPLKVPQTPAGPDPSHTSCLGISAIPPFVFDRPPAELDGGSET